MFKRKYNGVSNETTVMSTSDFYGYLYPRTENGWTFEVRWKKNDRLALAGYEYNVGGWVYLDAENEMFDKIQFTQDSHDNRHGSVKDKDSAHEWAKEQVALSEKESYG